MKSLRLPRRSLVVLAWMALAGAIQPLFAVDTGVDVAAIRSLLQSAFDKPDALLNVEPVTVGSTFAVAGWRQGERGGRALLRREHGQWTVVLCSGDPLRHEAGLIEAGVPKEEAAHLAAAIATAEDAFDKEAIRSFSSFEGTVDMTAHPHKSHHP
jgi:hypothetical protein